MRFHNAANDALAKLDEGGTDISPDRLRVRALRFNLRAAMILERFVDHVKKQDAGAGGGDPARPTAR